MPELLNTAVPEIESSRSASLTLVDRVLEAVQELAPAFAGGPNVWARGAGPHVLVGLDGEEAFARLTPLGGGLFGLAFRAIEARASHVNAWEPLLLIDELPAAVEHALVAVEALVIQ